MNGALVLPKKALADQRGLTLIELVITLALLSILAASSVLVFNNTRERGKVANFYNELRLIKLGATRFEADCGFFPLDVGKGVDPGLAEKYGWRDGQHSSSWDTADSAGMLDGWNGPYLEAWTLNPWGGYYDWDNYPPGFTYMGIQGGAVFVSLRPKSGAGEDGMPSNYYERMFEKDGLDVVSQDNIVSIWVGRYGPGG